MAVPVDINWLAVLAAALSAFLLGGLWYGPLFRRAWCRETGMDQDAPPSGHPARIFGTAFAAALTAAVAFAIMLGPAPPWPMPCASASSPDWRMSRWPSASITRSPAAASGCG